MLDNQFLLIMIGLIFSIVGLGLAQLRQQGKKITNEKHRAYFDDFVDMIYDIVDATDQTVTEPIKEARGKLTKEEQKTIFNSVKEKALSRLSDEAKSVLQKFTTDIDALTEDKIEGYINRKRLEEKEVGAQSTVVHLGGAETDCFHEQA